MDNALNNENLETQGQINDNVGQDENQTQDDGASTDWESQAKYFQSEKDKLHTENQKLKDYEKVGKLLESRPDIVNTISGMVQGGQPAQLEKIRMSSTHGKPIMTQHLNRISFDNKSYRNLLILQLKAKWRVFRSKLV
jgi:hypothetical protein